MLLPVAGPPALVSIIIPTYNRARLLAAALRSVQAQSYPHTQIIVIDDGSTDNTREVVAEFAGVEYYFQPNGGQAAARNAGLSHCQGTYLASLDSDDEWEPGFLAESVGLLEQHALDFVFANWSASLTGSSLLRFFAGLGSTRRYCTHALGDWWLLEPAQTRRLFIETCPAPSSALVLRRAALAGRWNEQMRIADDWCLLLDMVLNQPLRAAFTLQPRWTKHVQHDNIYDGRDRLAVIQELGFHDELLLADRFRAQLSRHERRIFQRRLAQHYFAYAYVSWQRALPATVIAHHVAKALYLAPLIIGREVAGGVVNKLRKWLYQPGKLSSEP